MKITEIEERLKITEKALNEALKELEMLKNTGVVATPFKEVIDKKVYDGLFDFYYDKTTGKKCPADEVRKSANLRNLQNNILMCLGYTYPQKNLKCGFYYAKVQPIKTLIILSMGDYAI